MKSNVSSAILANCSGDIFRSAIANHETIFITCDTCREFCVDIYGYCGQLGASTKKNLKSALG